MTGDKKKVLFERRKRMFYIGVILALMIIMIGAGCAIRQDSAVGQPTGNVIAKSSEVVERNFFNIAITRIPLSVVTYNPDDEESNYTLGANGDLDKMDFGVLPTSSPARKQIDLSNDRDQKVKVRVKAYGEMGEYISVDDDEFILEPNEKKTVTISYEGRADETEMDGELDIIVIVPKNGYESMISIA